MKVAAVNLKAEFADTKVNMEKAERLVQEAAGEGAEIVSFPEFFNTGFALNPALIPAVMQSQDTEERLREWSRKYQIVIGASYLKYEEGNIYNQYGLFFPGGESYFHKKDIPTALENFCYDAGDEVSAFETPLGKIGVVMCWEQIRYQTVKRMQGKVDFLIGGSCWWNFVPEDGELIYSTLQGVNRELAVNAPLEFAKILGVPMIHASHTGNMPGLSIGEKGGPCVREIVSESVICDGYGKLLQKGSKEDEVIVCDMIPGRVTTETVILKDDYWIPDMPELLVKGFHVLNEKYHTYYEAVTKKKLGN